MKRFMIGTNRTTAEQDAAFHKILKNYWPHLGWWHQLGETWLIIDLTDQITCAQLRDAAKEAFPGINLIVVQANGPHEWAGFARPTDFVWIKEQWDRDG